MPGPSSHRDLSRRPMPRSSRDLTVYTLQEIDQLRKSNATIKLTRVQAIKLFFWNSNHNTVCYRNGQSWLFMLLFYPLFIALILGLFYGMMLIMITCIKTFAKTPVINKNSLTKEPSYI
ncbi:hypothetical protein Zmor_016006 [Zophobas morio]|uniref:Uncharacterized protein n=1 Tax=Zophobas morio TaxID=2755281 RepID=A0AA38IPH5_9CUCU|nr:hypothetical protein Zmor_016006 [Zophobas morio]